MTDKKGPARPDDQPPIINIAGEKVALGPLRRDLVPLYQRWYKRLRGNALFGHHATDVLGGTGGMVRTR